MSEEIKKKMQESLYQIAKQVDECICPECDHVQKKERGTPCKTIKCEKCDAKMEPHLVKETEVKKQNEMATLKNKSINIRQAENGVMLEISEEWEIPATKEQRRDWHWKSRSYVFKDMKEAMPVMLEEMKPSKTEMTLKDLLGTKKHPGVKIKTMKSIDSLAFMTSVEGNHLHMAMGKIVDKKVDKETVKFFVGKTMDDKVFGLMGEGDKAESDETKKVKSSLLKAHSHSFSIRLDKNYGGRYGVNGETDTINNHSHLVDVLDLRSQFVSNTPDKKEG